jgi:excisionase family DNA binding protein
MSAALTAPLLTRIEAAEALNLSPRTIDGLLASGDLPAVRVGRSVRIRPSAIDYFIESRETRKNPQRAKTKALRTKV